MTAEPLNHIKRTDLPWREADRAVCGRVLAECREELILTLAEAQAMQKRLGQQRFALVICMTCASHTASWAEWDANPIARISRECSAGGGYWPSVSAKPELFAAELRAIAFLIAEHRDQFDGLVADLMSGALTPFSQLGKKRRKGV